MGILRLIVGLEANLDDGTQEANSTNQELLCSLSELNGLRALSASRGPFFMGYRVYSSDDDGVPT
jgi:hypothetical protein